jgi:hypothetical protein
MIGKVTVMISHSSLATADCTSGSPLSPKSRDTPCRFSLHTEKKSVFISNKEERYPYKVVIAVTVITATAGGHEALLRKRLIILYEKSQRLFMTQ